MNIRDWLTEATQNLQEAEITTAKLDVLVLLEDVLNKNRAQLLAHPELRITPEQERILSQLLTRRAKHEPLAYIRGKSEFYGREFIVNNHVLQPRPESETMIDMLKKLPISSPRITDIGTGSGALAVTAKLEIPTSNVCATDVDSNCITIAKKNARKHEAKVEFIQTNLLDGLKHQDILLCNLPYVPDDFPINKSAEFEPRLALFGGADGLDLYRKLFGQIENMDTKPVFVLTESLPLQHKELAKIAQKHGYKRVQEQDFIQLFSIN